jgi:hypothetical protein
VSVGSAGLLRGVERAAFADTVTDGVVKRILKTGGSEFAQEGIEEGGGKLAENIAASRADVTADPLKGVGSAATQGALVGAGLGTGVGLFKGRTDEPVVPPAATPPGADADTGAAIPPPPPGTPGTPGEELNVDPAEFQRRTADYMNVGYAEGYAQAEVLAEMLREREQERKATKDAASVPPVDTGEPISEPTLVKKPPSKRDVIKARQQIQADAAAFPDDLLRKPTREEIEIAAQEMTLSPEVAGLDMINRVMERNDASAPAAPAVEPVAEPEVAAPMTVEEYVDAYVAGEGRDDLGMQQFGANNAAEIEAEFQRRAQASKVEPTPTSEPIAEPEVAAPTYSYADLVREADELVSSGQLSPENYQQATMLAELATDEANAGTIPSPMEARQFLYEQAGTEAPAFVTPTPTPTPIPTPTPTSEPIAEPVAETLAPEVATPEEEESFELTYDAVEAEIDDAVESGALRPGVANLLKGRITKAFDALAAGDTPKFTPQDLMGQLNEAAPPPVSAPAPASPPPAMESPTPTPEEAAPPPPPPSGAAPAAAPTPTPKKPRAPRRSKTAEEVAAANKKAEEATAGYRAELATKQSLAGSGLADPLAEAFAAHDVKDKSGFIREAFERFFKTLDYANLRMQLFRLPTRELVIELERASVVPAAGGRAPIRVAYDFSDKAKALRDTLLNAGGRLQEDLNKFIAGDGTRKYRDSKKRQSALYGMLDLARGLAFNPAAHATLDAALQNDSVMEIARDRIANAKRPQDAGKAKRQLDERTDMIERGWKYWEALGKIDGGHATFNKLVDYYAALTRLTRNEIDGLLRSLKGKLSDEDVSQLTKAIEDIDSGFDQTAKEALQGDIFDDIPTRNFPVVYVPYNRFGKYVLQIKPGSPQFSRGARFQYDTLADREADAKRLAQGMGISPDDGPVFERSSNPKKSAMGATDEAGVLRNVLRIVRDADLNISPSTISETQSRAEATLAFRKDLEAQLTEMLLTALPEESIRKQFIRAKGVVGRSTDHARVLAYNVQRYANQLPRLKFGYQLRNALDEAYAELDGAESSTAKEMVGIMLDEVDKRLNEGLNPPANNPLFAALNSFGHTMLLSAPASALNNAIVTWQRAAFELATDYGPKAAVTLAKLEGVMRLMGTVQDDPTGNVRRYYAPSVIKLPMIKNNPVYLKAFTEMRDVYGLFGHGFVNEIILQGRTSSTRPRTVPGYVMDGAQKIAGIINAPFGAVERITNEKVGMATFILEYDKQKAAGKTDTEASDAAIDKARRVVADIIGKYGQAERPPLFKGPGTVLFLFKTFALNLGAFIERQLKVLTYEPLAALGDLARLQKPKKRSIFTKAEKRQATKTLMALYAGNFVWSGVSGTFGFTTIAKMLAPFIFLFMDDDEEDEWRRENPEYVNNMPGYIIEKLIPETFGGYGDLVAYGPVSALTGVSLSSRVGYDNMFFRDPVAKTGNIWSDTKSWFLDNFAAGTGRADDFMEGVNFFMEGNAFQAAKRLLPAAIGSPIKAVAAFNEGITDARGRPIIEKDEDKITLRMAAMLALGYQPLEVSKTYARLYGSAEQLGAIKAQRGKLMRKLNDARTKQDYDAIDEVREEIEDFNALNPGMAITSKTEKRSRQAYEGREKNLYRGMAMTEEDRERIRQDIEPYWDPDE